MERSSAQLLYFISILTCLWKLELETLMSTVNLLFSLVAPLTGPMRTINQEKEWNALYVPLWESNYSAFYKETQLTDCTVCWW